MEEEKVLSQEEKERILKQMVDYLINHHPGIYRHRDIELPKLQQVFSALNRETDSDFILATYPDDEELMQYIFSVLMIKNQIKSDVVILNAFELIEIFFGRDESLEICDEEKRFNSLLQIRRKLIILDLGIRDIQNKKLEELIIQLMEMQRKRRDGKLWLFFQGYQFDIRYPNVIKLMKLNKAGIYNFRGTLYSDTEATRETLDNLITAIRESGISKRQLANKSGVNLDIIQDIENGTCNPSIKTLNRLAKGIGKKIEIGVID